METKEFIINEVKDEIHKNLISQLSQIKSVSLDELACPEESDGIQGQFRTKNINSQNEDLELRESLEIQGVLEPLVAIKNLPNRPDKHIIINGARRYRLLMENPDLYLNLPARVVDYKDLITSVKSGLTTEESITFAKQLSDDQLKNIVVESLKSIFLSMHSFLKKITDEDYFNYFLCFKSNHNLKPEKLMVALRSLGRKQASEEYNNLRRLWKVASSEIAVTIYRERLLPLNILKKDYVLKIIENEGKAQSLYNHLVHKYEEEKENAPINKKNHTLIELLDLSEYEDTIKVMAETPLNLSPEVQKANSLRRKKVKCGEKKIEIPAITLDLSNSAIESQAATLHVYFQLIKFAAEIHSKVLGAGCSLDLLQVTNHGIDKIYCKTILLHNKIECADFTLMDKFFKTCPYTCEVYQEVKKKVQADYDGGFLNPIHAYKKAKKSTIVNERAVRHFIEKHRKEIMHALEN